MNKDLKKRIESESKAARRITNEDLICKDCRYVLDDSLRYGNTSKCLMYDEKPNSIFLDNECLEYEKEK